ncbi:MULTISPECIES: metal ABC transporter ATP-binding protein [Clostridium]|uniref:Metal ABC transporter ATP-binding protein n=1 Tax=Clostridium cibarium TaxID=2762247 RepID=A0ABR8PP07_9CLOT|nr:metal ABC transporter ATP-binding protein [Clostridium sp. HBUAS56017]MBD7909906.1 metal ABC transporter ATP-binding protein [Clostridium cibarium]
MIKITNMNFSYDKSQLLLNNINLHIPKGIYLSIVGENGSCKTTLIKLILGLLTPNSGSIEVNASKISYVPQRVDGFNSDFPISVFEILKTHSKALHLNSDRAINDVLAKVNMESFKDSLIGNLSGGQQQRIFIARALMGNPDLIILDEPSTGVDFKSQQEIYSILNYINKELGTTIISIEHNMDIAAKYSSHILKIKEGKVSLKTCEEFMDEMPLRGA